ncbi:Uncharacterised protein [Candidatus Venteria ishoeyi]|uniref:Uncharacterized protein n=1 Tax=Candidatus Venteria ishoeyi TaxID=1899563 RepID=A0A1H6F561_9GAMM|nr:Uncharacterised protein [Candidatus Venteria ishoeyi]
MAPSESLHTGAPLKPWRICSPVSSVRASACIHRFVTGPRVSACNQRPSLPVFAGKPKALMICPEKLLAFAKLPAQQPRGSSFCTSSTAISDWEEGSRGKGYQRSFRTLTRILDLPKNGKSTSKLSVGLSVWFFSLPNTKFTTCAQVNRCFSVTRKAVPAIPPFFFQTRAMQWSSIIGYSDLLLSSFFHDNLTL